MKEAASFCKSVGHHREIEEC